MNVTVQKRAHTGDRLLLTLTGPTYGGRRDGVGWTDENVSLFAKHKCSRITQYKTGLAIRGLTYPQGLFSIFTDRLPDPTPGEVEEERSSVLCQTQRSIRTYHQLGCDRMSCQVGVWRSLSQLDL